MSSVALFTCPRLDGMVGVMLQRQKGGALNLKRHSDRHSIEIQSRLEGHFSSSAFDHSRPIKSFSAIQ